MGVVYALVNKRKGCVFVKSSIKKITAFILLVLLCCSLCGCTVFDSEVSDLLKAPKLTGEMRPIQQALENSLKDNYTLIFPNYGEYRSAITMRDIDADNVNEAIVFYSTTVENTVNVHIAVVDNNGGEWAVTAEQNLVGADVERVVFDDLNSDGRLEILVGWNIYGNVDKKLKIYEYTGASMITVLEEPYSCFVTCDLNDDFSNDVMVIYLNTTTALSQASYFSMTTDTIDEIGNCHLDGSVTAYYDPIVSKTADGAFCVYIDAAKGAGLITEIIYFEDGVLKNPFYDIENPIDSPTLRTSVVTCKDFDGDTVVEVPIMQPLPVEEQFSINQQAYLTKWCVYGKDEFVEKMYALVNYNDGYYINLDKSMIDDITVTRVPEKRQRTIYAYDYEENKFLNELFHIRAVTPASVEAGNYSGEGYIKLAENESLVYLLKISEYAPEYGFTEGKIKEMFVCIEENA